MLNIKFDPNRKREEGQYYVELVTFEPDLTMAINGRFGYWCDLEHIKVGVLPILISEFPEEILEGLKEYVHRIEDKLECFKKEE